MSRFLRHGSEVSSADHSFQKQETTTFRPFGLRPGVMVMVKNFDHDLFHSLKMSHVPGDDCVSHAVNAYIREFLGGIRSTGRTHIKL